MISTEELYALYRECGCRVTTDSRSIEGGEIFFALKGDSFNGNTFAHDALEKGAAWAVVDEKVPGLVLPNGLLSSDRFILVEDSFKTLQALAIHHRNAVATPRLPVIGLTGTNGKTTTKELMAAVLSCKYKVCATEGNLNNDIGVPLSLLKIRPDTEIAVIEMGASHPDDIAKLVKVCQPDFGLITNVGRAHLQGFGSFEGVKAAKGELYKWLGEHEGSMLFLNQDDPDLVAMARKIPTHVWGYGLEYQGAEVLPTSPSNPFLSIKLRSGVVVRTHLVGAYNASNVMAALSIGEFFGIPAEKGARAIAAYEPRNNRSQLLKTRNNTVIVDAYNANASSMKVALENLASVQLGKKDTGGKIALLGDMRELGAESRELHCGVIRTLQQTGLDACLVGEEFTGAAESMGFETNPDVAAAVGQKTVLGCFRNSAELVMYLSAHRIAGAMILVKGSRSLLMEKVLVAL